MEAYVKETTPPYRVPLLQAGQQIPPPVEKPGGSRRPRRDTFDAPEQEIVGKRPPGPEAGDRRGRRDITRTPNVNEWRSRVILKASWRGVEFELETYSLPIGRKSFVHEFAQSDGIFVEDNGRATRYHKLIGFVTGDDYDIQRDALIRALETEGPGDFIHPYFGVRRCRSVDPCTVSEAVREQRYAKFDLTFVDVDEGLFPREIVDFPAVVQRTGLALTVKTLALATKTESVLRAQNALPYIQNFLKFTTAIEDHALTLIALALDGTEFRDEFATLLLTIFDVQLLVSVLQGWVKAPQWANTDEEAAGRAFSTWARTEIENRAAVLVAVTDYPSYDAAVREATSVLEQIIIDEDETTDAGAYTDLIDLRVNMMMGVYNLGSILPRERDLEVVAPTPAIVLAWDLYADPLRDQEIIARNMIVHPNFASGTLKVVTR